MMSKNLPTKTTFHHPRQCWDCEKMVFEFQMEYCKKCEEVHRLCLKCYPKYYLHEKLRDSKYPINMFSDRTMKINR